MSYPSIISTIEYSLEEYKGVRGLPSVSKSKILDELMKDPSYVLCQDMKLKKYHLRKSDVDACTRALYHELSKHAHGTNAGELCIRDTEHTMTEIAAIECVFCALKKRDCFRLPLKIIIGYFSIFIF